jgi:hypothetical protein
MSKTAYFWMCILCIVILLGGLAYGSMAQAQLPPDCDNKCRARYTFRLCQPSGLTACYYVDEETTTCLFCMGTNNKCLPQSSDSPNSTCTSVSNQISISRKSYCVTTCACDASPTYAQWREASASAGDTDPPVTLSQYVCP